MFEIDKNDSDLYNKNKIVNNNEDEYYVSDEEEDLIHPLIGEDFLLSIKRDSRGSRRNRISLLDLKYVSFFKFWYQIYFNKHFFFYLQIINMGQNE